MKSPVLTFGVLCFATLSISVLALLHSGSVVAQDVPKQVPAKSKSAAAPATAKPEKEAILHINTAMEAVWKEKGLRPSDRATDLEWFRRINLDLIGRVPSLDETTDFLAMDEQARRASVIENLLASDDHARYFGRFWQKAVINTGGGQIRFGLRQLGNYLSESVASNRPYDQMVRDMLTATGEVPVGDPRAASAAGYLVAFNNEIPNLTGNVSRAFLGVEIQCVQCHNDLIGERWNQPDFQSFAAIFNLTNSRRKSNDRQDAGYNTFVLSDRPYRAPNARVLARLKERAKDNPTAMERLDISAATPRALGVEEPITGSDGLELRRNLAAWMTSKDNEWFSRTAVNRIWAHLMKRGFVDPVDDFSSLNVPSNPELLAWLSKDFAASGFDLKRLIRIIVGTRAYQMTSRPNHAINNKDDLVYYSRGYIEQLGAEELFDSIVSATGMDRVVRRAGDGRALGLIREGLLRQFRFVIDDDEGKERETFSGTVPQALMMMNGDFVDRAVSASPGGTLSEILRTRQTTSDRVKAMYLAILTREPNTGEMNRMVEHIDSERGTVAAYEDVFWALLNSAEFLNNH